MLRRVHEDRNQHYNDLSCGCYQLGKAMARFKEQPCLCSKHAHGCGNPRRSPYERAWAKLSVQERREMEGGTP
jgi:hypothetical protein